MPLAPLPLLIGALWGGLIDDATIEGSRAPAEIRDALRPLQAELRGCVDKDGAVDVVVEVEFAAAGSVTGAAVVVSGRGDSGHVSVGCVLHVIEGVLLKDRGSEPPTHVLLRFTNQTAPAPLPWLALKKSIQRSHADIARCVRRLRVVQPALHGSVLARIALDDGGRVAAVDVDGTDAGLNGCVQGALKAVYVDDGFADHVVTAPFAFEADPRYAGRDEGLDPRPLSADEHKTFFSFIGCDLPIP